MDWFGLWGDPVMEASTWFPYSTHLSLSTRNLVSPRRRRRMRRMRTLLPSAPSSHAPSRLISSIQTLTPLSHPQEAMYQKYPQQSSERGHQPLWVCRTLENLARRGKWRPLPIISVKLHPVLPVWSHGGLRSSQKKTILCLHQPSFRDFYHRYIYVLGRFLLKLTAC